MTNHFIAVFRLTRAALGGGAGLVGGAAAGSASDAATAGLGLWPQCGGGSAAQAGAE